MSDIEYLASTRARRVRITVERGGTVKVVYPHRIARARVEAWVSSRQEWIVQAQQKIQSRGGIALPKSGEGRVEFQKQKKQARLIVEQHLSVFRTQFAWKKVRIVNARTRWGSCSTRGTLSFNWRIVYLAENLQRYLIVHELCHLRHHNHSVQFWAAVEEFCPDYKTLRRTLKGYHF